MSIHLGGSRDTWPGDRGLVTARTTDCCRNPHWQLVAMGTVTRMVPDHIGRLSWLSVSASPPAVHCRGAESWGQEGWQRSRSGDVTCQPVTGRVSRVPHDHQGVSFPALRVFMRGGAPECPWNSGHRGEGEHDWLLYTCRLYLCLPGSRYEALGQEAPADAPAPQAWRTPGGEASPGGPGSDPARLPISTALGDSVCGLARLPDKGPAAV